MRTSLDIPTRSIAKSRCARRANAAPSANSSLKVWPCAWAPGDSAAQILKVPLSYSTRKGKLVTTNKRLSKIIDFSFRAGPS